MSKKIRITFCNAQGKQFEHLTPGSEHEIIPTPEKYKHLKGVWVFGKTEPVRLLTHEYEHIKE